jgi:HKD family nuclease
MSPQHQRTRWIGAALAVGLCLLLVNRPGTEKPAGAVTAPAAAAVAPTIPTTAPVHTTLAGYPVWAHFTNPRAYPGGVDDTIHAELRRLIRNAKPNSTIRGSIHSLNMVAVAQELVNAQDQRNVDVRLVIDGKNDVKDPNDAVVLIKKIKHVEFCKDGGRLSCISTNSSGIMHAKLFTFTETTDPTGAARQKVSWFGSPNLTDTSGSKQFNNAITVYGDEDLFDGLNAYFGDMYAKRDFKDNDYYDSGAARGYYMATAADAYASPEQVGETDTIATRLNDLTPDTNCKLRIGMKSVHDNRPKLVTLVEDFRKAGCQVWIVVTTKSNGDIDMDEDVYEDFIKAGVQIRKIKNIHDKFFVAYGKFGATYQARVYTGSQNWTKSALNYNDELFVKMAPESATVHPLYDGYVGHFNNAFYSGTPCTKDKDSCY